jgi:hypothetical protein
MSAVKLLVRADGVERACQSLEQVEPIGEYCAALFFGRALDADKKVGHGIGAQAWCSRIEEVCSGERKGEVADDRKSRLTLLL